MHKSLQLTCYDLSVLRQNVHPCQGSLIQLGLLRGLLYHLV